MFHISRKTVLGQGDANESGTGFQPVLFYLAEMETHPTIDQLGNPSHGYPALARVHCYSPDFPEELYFFCSIGELYCSIGRQTTVEVNRP
jgi:hypothetical protein